MVCLTSVADWFTSNSALEGQCNGPGSQSGLISKIIPAGDIDAQGEDAKPEAGRWDERGLGILHVLEGTESERQQFGQNRLFSPRLKTWL